MQTFKIDVKPKVARLDSVVSNLIANLSRSKAKKLISQENILVNNAPSKASYNVRMGDKIQVEIPLEREVSLKPEKIPLKIVYEDSSILVIDKQPGLVTHPTVDHPSGTLVNGLLNHLGEMDESDNLRPGIVHRLDKDTSGLLVIGKRAEATEKLKKQFKGRSVTKKYLAVVGGVVEKEKGVIINKIGRHPRFRSKFAIDPVGREAETEYKVLKRFKNATLLELHPKTGRTHQLRVHLASIGHPIIGDKLYGGKMLINRQFLHASFLSFAHPETGKRMEFETPLPSDLEEFLNKIDQ